MAHQSIERASQAFHAEIPASTMRRRLLTEPSKTQTFDTTQAQGSISASIQSLQTAQENLQRSKAFEASQRSTVPALSRPAQLALLLRDHKTLTRELSQQDLINVACSSRITAEAVLTPIFYRDKIATRLKIESRWLGQQVSNCQATQSLFPSPLGLTPWKDIYLDLREFGDKKTWISSRMPPSNAALLMELSLCNVRQENALLAHLKKDIERCFRDIFINQRDPNLPVLPPSGSLLLSFLFMACSPLAIISGLRCILFGNQPNVIELANNEKPGIAPNSDIYPYDILRGKCGDREGNFVVIMGVVGVCISLLYFNLAYEQLQPTLKTKFDQYQWNKNLASLDAVIATVRKNS